MTAPSVTETSSLPVTVSRPVPRRISKLRRLGSSLMRRWGLLVAKLDRCVMRVAACTGFGASLYYTFCSSKFRREHRAVLRGRLQFAIDELNPAKSSALFRRGIHRLEKGLTMRPRRDVFGLDYIEDCVSFYARIVSDPNRIKQFDSGELKWAHDVLSDFFAVAGRHAKIDRLRTEFRNLPSVNSDGGDQRFVPYLRDLSGPPTVNYDDLLQLAYRRRSVRWFQPRPVARELIENAIAVAAQSPSACNRQPFVFRVFDDPELTKRVAAIPYGTAGYSENIPVVVVLVGRLRSYFDERDRHLIYIDSSLAAMGFVYALEAQGLSSCCINWPDLPECEIEMAKTIGLDDDERPIMLIAVGYPDAQGLVAYSQKKPMDQLCQFNLEK